MVINVMISTIDEGIYQVENVLLPYRGDVKYIISHQYTNNKKTPIPEKLIREDVVISQIPGKGVSKSRNNAISLAEGDIGLFADDDLTYKNSYFDDLKNIFLQSPDLDIALLKIKTKSNEPVYKNYSDEIEYYSKIRHSVSSVEIAVNLDTIKKEGLIFDERFGAGNKKIIGSEETVFLYDAIKLGLNVIFYPVYVTEHPFESTIKSVSKFDVRRNWVTGALDCRTNGVTAIPKAFLGTIKYFPDLIRQRKNPMVYFFQRLTAVLYILITNRKYKR